MLSWLERKVLRDFLANPLWGPALGTARTLLAAGTLITVGLTDHRALFAPAAGIPPGPRCDDVLAATLFCWPGAPVGTLRWVAVAVLLVVASGWRPRWTCVPHWYVSWSLFATATIADGGDQVTAVLTLLLIPVGLADSRRWHWQRDEPTLDRPAWRVAVPVMTRYVIRLQLAVLYFQAAASKFGVEQWVEGTATYYWLSNPTFGAAGAVRWAMDAAASVPILQAGLTWGAVAIELGIALAILFASSAVRRATLIAGIALHAGIALTLGIVSFSLAMFGALILALWWPVGSPVPPEARVPHAPSRANAPLAEEMPAPDRAESLSGQ